MELGDMHANIALYLEQARRLMSQLKDVAPSRAASISLTELETAMLWFEEHQRLQRVKGFTNV